MQQAQQGFFRAPEVEQGGFGDVDRPQAQDGPQELAVGVGVARAGDDRQLEPRHQAAQHAGSAADLLEQLLNNWWLRIGETYYARIPKLMVAEARNFPEVAQFYYESVIRRSRALIGAALERGMASGEFRRMEVETCIEVVISPVLMLLIWRFSMGACQSKQVDPRQYLAVHMDLLRRGLQANRV